MRTFRALALLCTVCGVGGCLAPGSTATRDAPKSVAVTRSAVVVAGPPGFCIDESATRDRADSAFVLLASCAAISNIPLMPQPDIPAVLAASVTRAPAPSPQSLERYFRSPAGLSQLNTSGEVQTVDLRADDDALFVLTDGKDGAHWRGIIPLEPGIIVTVSLQSTTSQPVPEGLAYATLSTFADRILAANPPNLLATRGS